MTDDAATALERLLSASRGGLTLVLLFDYDGTLVPITSHPSLAVLTSETRALLERLASLPRVAVGVLSGRSLADVVALVGIPGLYHAGTSGMELDLRGRVVRHTKEREAATLIARVAEQLRPVPADFAGAWIESKAAGLTVHYRNVRTDRLTELLESITLCLAPWTAQLTTVGGPMAIEVTPQDGWNKGTAVQMILDHVGRDSAFPVFIGDEANDADAFAVVSALGGASIGVGTQAPSTASYRLRDPNAVTEFLAAVLESLEERRTKP